MASSLTLLVVSLLASSPAEALLQQKPRTNRERAKIGLLPRRSAPSRVTYLAEAARSRRDVRPFPVQVASAMEFEEVAGPPNLVAASVAVAQEPEAAAAPRRPSLASATPAPMAETPAPVEPQRTSEPPTPVVPREPLVEERVPPQPAVAPPQPPAAVVPAQPAVRRAEPMQQGTRVALVAERVVDGQGRLVVRLLGARRTVLSERVTGTVDELPIQWSGRAANGEVIQVVEDTWGPIEIHRDPVGRFLSVRTLADWDEEE